MFENTVLERFIYSCMTSGSSGEKEKIVKVAAPCILSNLNNLRRRCPIRNGESVVVLSPFTFDSGRVLLSFYIFLINFA